MKRLVVLLILLIPVLTNAQSTSVKNDSQEIILQNRHFSYINKLMEPTGDVLLEIVGKYSPDQLRSHRINQLEKFSKNYPMSSRSSKVLTMLADLFEENSQLTHSLAVHLKQIAFFPGTSNYANSVSKIEGMVANNTDLMEFKSTIDLYVRGNPAQTSYQQSLYRYLYMLHQFAQPEIADLTLNEMRQYIEDFPHAADAARIYYWMGDIYTSIEEYPEAVLSFKRAAELYPESLAAPEALLQAAVVLKDEFNVPEQTVKLLQSIVESDYSDEVTIRATKAIADLYAQSLGQPQKALEIYAGIIENYPGRRVAAEAMFGQAQLYANQLNNPERAIEMYLSIPELIPAAREIGADATRNAADLKAGVSKDYYDALSLYLDFAINYPWHDDVPDRLMKAAEITEKQYRDPDMTIDLLDVIIDRYPNTNTANLAQRRLARYTNANW